MSQFRVRWEIDIEAGSPQEAANQARAIQLDPLNTATHFTMQYVGVDGRCIICDRVGVHHKTCRLRKRFSRFNEVGNPESLMIDQTYSAEAKGDQ